MHLAYIISAYKLPDLLIRLVNKLQSEDVSFFIHVDKKSPSNIFKQMKEGLKDFSNVYFLKQHNCYWGDFGHVEASLKGIKELITRGIPFDYAILLTGQDYPLKTNNYIKNYFSENDGKSFMSYTPLPNKDWDVMYRLERWEYRIWGKPIVIPLRVKGKRYRNSVIIRKLINLFLPAKRRFLRDMKPYGGSSYWNLSREAVYYISDYLNDNPDFIRFFRSTNIPDELFFQTLLLNSLLEDRIINDHLRYGAVDLSNKMTHPVILREKDFSALCSSAKLFARKFDTSIDSRILDMIDERIPS